MANRDYLALKLAVLIVMILTLSACAGSDSGSDQRSDRQRIAQAYDRHMHGSRDATVYPAVREWYYLGNDRLAVRTSNYRYFMLEVSPACGNELSWGSNARITTEQQTRNRLTRQDKLKIGNRECRITGLWRLDYKALREELDDAGITHRFLRLREN